MWLIPFLLLIDVPIQHNARTMEKKIDVILNRPALADSFWGIMVYSPYREKVLYQSFPRKNFRPASTMKILTTLLGFEYLGSDFQYQTPIYHSGHWDRENGILHGDLIILGRGDPSMSGNYDGDGLTTEKLLAPMLDRLKSLGLRKIEGDFIAVTSYFDDVTWQKSWEWDDLGTAYGAPVTPLSINDAWIRLDLETDAQGQPSYQAFPPWISDLEISFATQNLGDHVDIQSQRILGTNRVQISGQFPACSQKTLTISAWDPNQHFLETLQGLMTQRGIVLQGGLKQSTSLPEVPITLVETFVSPSFAHLAKTIMRASQNHYADCVLKTVGREVLGVGSFEAGAEVAEQFLRSTLQNLHEPQPSLLGIHIRDGSGLSGQNYLQPNYLVHLLRYGLNQPYRKDWLATFPIFGRDGTLKHRGLENSPALGRVWAKTGYIYRTRTLAGYVVTLSGEPLIFAIMTNNYSAMTAEINRTQDHICDLLVRLEPNHKARRQIAKTKTRWPLRRP